MQQTFISVIIPAWNAAESICTCLHAIRRQTYSSEFYEVIVVDNGSTDNTADLVSSFDGVKLLTESKVGSYNARNTGLGAALGELVLFTDADCVPSSDWLEAAARAYQGAGTVGVLGGRVEFFRASEQRNDACLQYELLFGFQQFENVRRGRCVTANWASPREVLLRLGGFNPRYKSGGDVELAGRISSAGLPIIYCHEMVVSHPARANTTELISKRRRVVGGMWEGAPRRWRPLWVATKILRALLRKWRRAVLARNVGLVVRFRLLALIARLELAALAELGALTAGSSPRRA